jgi:hypothetical protein
MSGEREKRERQAPRRRLETMTRNERQRVAVTGKGMPKGFTLKQRSRDRPRNESGKYKTYIDGEAGKGFTAWSHGLLEYNAPWYAYGL